jgi:hypothetical protein
MGIGFRVYGGLCYASLGRQGWLAQDGSAASEKLLKNAFRPAVPILHVRNNGPGVAHRGCLRNTVVQLAGPEFSGVSRVQEVAAVVPRGRQGEDVRTGAKCSGWRG